MDMSKDCEAKDRISNLPDSIVHHILSFLSIKDVARTCVLSHRWNHIWTTVPALHFTVSTYGTGCSTAEKFMDFVDGTLHRHNSSNIDKFSLVYYQNLNESRVHSWISTVIRGKVKELRLGIHQDKPLFIPRSLFTCESLTSLHLITHPNIRLPKYISFPRLKHLELIGFDISDESWNEQLFSNSPVLEELRLSNCFYGMRNFSISIPTLKLLKIDMWRNEFNGVQDCVLKIDAPRLVKLSYKGFVAKEFVLSSFPLLVEATIDFSSEENVGAEGISRLLRVLAHVKCLTVDNKTLQAIRCACSLSNNFLTFHNVKMLEISGKLTTDQGLTALLKALPNLEFLVFDEHMLDEIVEYSDDDYVINSDVDDSDETEVDMDDYNEHMPDEIVEFIDDDDEKNSDEDDSDDTEVEVDDDNDADSVEGENNHGNEGDGDVADAVKHDDDYDSEDYSWELDILTTGCLFPHLKSVCFKQFVGNPREMKWVRLVLRDAKALQMMTIHYFDRCRISFLNAKQEEEVEEETPNFPRASAGCVFKFYSLD